MSKQYIVKTQMTKTTITVEANSAREAVTMVAEGTPMIGGRRGTLVVRKARNEENLYLVRRSSNTDSAERWRVTEAPVEVVAEVATVEVVAPAEVVAEQITVNAEQGQITLDIVSGATVESTAKQFAVEALANGADAKFLARQHADRIAKAAGVMMSDDVARRIRTTVGAVVAKYDAQLYA